MGHGRQKLLIQSLYLSVSVDSLENLQRIDPYEFEELVADVWSAKGYYTKVRKKSGDRGVDIEAEKNGNTEIIQVKRYTGDNKVGSQAVRNYATLYQQIPEADIVVIVTSGKFTDSARELAVDLDVKAINGRELLRDMRKHGVELVSEVSYQRNSKSTENNRSPSSVFRKKAESPFINTSAFSKLSPNQGFVDSCEECGEEGTVWFGQRTYKQQRYTYLKCESCRTIWVSAGPQPGDRPDDDWVRLSEEDDLENRDIRQNVDDKTGKSDPECFIATAAYGTPHAEEIDKLRDFRDEFLIGNTVGEYLVEFYYRRSPPIADWVSQKEGRQKVIRTLIIEPSIWFTEYISSISD